jgi:RNA polymerase sigma-70 factor (ECF subfamily)
MKAMHLWRHSLYGSVDSIEEMPLPFELAERQPAALPLDVGAIHEQYSDFVWLTLQRFGVRDADAEDMLQEVFVVVHRRLDSFDVSGRMTTWLFGICMRVAAAYRRRAFRRHEKPMAEVPEQVAPEEQGPERAAATRQAQERLQAALDCMDLEKRAIFVMFELDEVPCDAIAEMLSIPIGTVYSRLHAARKDFQEALARVQAGARTRKSPPLGGRR